MNVIKLVKEEQSKNKEKDEFLEKTCLWSDVKCNTCNLDEILTCRFSIKDTIIFDLTFLIFFVPSLIGMIISSYWLGLLIYVIYWVVFLQIWENKTLCSHCPHYGEESKIIRCYGNYGLYKLWKYDPSPMSKSHQIQFILGIAILVLYPIPFLIVSNHYLLLILTITGIGIWVGVQSSRMCKRCINFSCPMNRVSNDLVKKYLEINKKMKQEWENAGKLKL